jgi:hypothetical protein
LAIILLSDGDVKTYDSKKGAWSTFFLSNVPIDRVGVDEERRFRIAFWQLLHFVFFFVAIVNFMVVVVLKFLCCVFSFIVVNFTSID